MAPTDPFYHTHVPASHDPHVATPYWGAFGTSSVDWCEANYLHSQYVAEHLARGGACSLALSRGFKIYIYIYGSSL